MTKKILWLSRHEMSQEQQSALALQLGQVLRLEGAADIVVIHLNITFPALGWEAADLIRGLMDQHDCWDAAGVFPAHVAGALIACSRDAGTLWCPVSVPAPAVEGETRGGGFIFSHWERFFI